MNLINLNGDNKSPANSIISLDLQSIIREFKGVPKWLKVLFLTTIVIGLLYFLMFKSYFYKSELEKINHLSTTTTQIQHNLQEVNNILIHYNDILLYLDVYVRVNSISTESLETMIGELVKYLSRTQRSEHEPHFQALQESIEFAKKTGERMKHIQRQILISDSTKVSETLRKARDELKIITSSH